MKWDQRGKSVIGALPVGTIVVGALASHPVTPK